MNTTADELAAAAETVETTQDVWKATGHLASRLRATGSPRMARRLEQASSVEEFGEIAKALATELGGADA